MFIRRRGSSFDKLADEEAAGRVDGCWIVAIEVYKMTQVEFSR